MTVLPWKQIGIIRLLTRTTIAVEGLDGFGPGECEKGGVAVGFVDGGKCEGGVFAGDVVVNLADRYFESAVLSCEGGGWVSLVGRVGGDRGARG